MSLQQFCFTAAHIIQPVIIGTGIFGSDSLLPWVAPIVLSPVMMAEHYPTILTPSLFANSQMFGLLYVLSASFYFYKQYQKAKNQQKTTVAFMAGLWFATIVFTGAANKGQTSPGLDEHMENYNTPDFILWHGFTHCVNLATLYMASSFSISTFTNVDNKNA